MTGISVAISKCISFQDMDMGCSQNVKHIVPWEEVAINLIGPWSVKVNGSKVDFNAFTCIDTILNPVKLILIANKTSLQS